MLLTLPHYLEMQLIVFAYFVQIHFQGPYVSGVVILLPVKFTVATLKAN